MTHQRPIVDLYGAQYGNFATQLYAEIRAATFGEDIGQNSWLTADELDVFISWLALARQSKLLDIACGSGGTALRIARRVGCAVTGIDMHEQGIAEARASAVREQLADCATFEQCDASQRLPLADSSVDAILCVDAINHLPDRPQVLREWSRLLRPGGRLVFTDPVIVTGPLTNEEIAIRSSIGFFLFVPAGTNERLLDEAGFEGVEAVDRTENIARTAARWHDARRARADALRRIEGEPTFEGQQRFLKVTAHLAAERRLSRLAFCATRRGSSA